MKNNKALTTIKTDSGREIRVQETKVNGERWHQSPDGGGVYDTKTEMKSCPKLNK